MPSFLRIYWDQDDHLRLIIILFEVFLVVDNLKVYLKQLKQTVNEYLLFLLKMQFFQNILDFESKELILCTVVLINQNYRQIDSFLDWKVR